MNDSNRRILKQIGILGAKLSEEMVFQAKDSAARYYGIDFQDEANKQTLEDPEAERKSSMGLLAAATANHILESLHTNEELMQAAQAMLPDPFVRNEAMCRGMQAATEAFESMRASEDLATMVDLQDKLDGPFSPSDVRRAMEDDSL